MRGAFLISSAPQFFAAVSHVLVTELAATADECTVQIINTLGILTVFNEDYLDVENWDVGLIEVNANTPEWVHENALVVECRSPSLFFLATKLLAERIGFPLKIVDSTNQVWDALNVDHDRFVL
jgi:hypothetical protein